jgi:hypothetical protein
VLSRRRCKRLRDDDTSGQPTVPETVPGTILEAMQEQPAGVVPRPRNSILRSISNRGRRWPLLAPALLKHPHNPNVYPLALMPGPPNLLPGLRLRLRLLLLLLLLQGLSKSRASMELHTARLGAVTMSRNNPLLRPRR